VIVLACLESPRPGFGAKAAEALARRLARHATTLAVTAGGGADCETAAWAMASRSFRRIIHIDDAALDKADFMMLGVVLAEIARQVHADVVIAGEHSGVEGQGLVPAALAQHLLAPLVARVQAVRPAPSDSASIEITVPAGGRLCTLSCPFPIVLTTALAAGAESTPDASGAASGVETLALAELGLDSSRLVPRPELLGSQIPISAQRSPRMTADEAACFLLRRQ
jgi:electron transfer flavoprotein alpha/beta subunit